MIERWSISGLKSSIIESSECWINWSCSVWDLSGEIVGGGCCVQKNPRRNLEHLYRVKGPQGDPWRILGADRQRWLVGCQESPIMDWTPKNGKRIPAECGIMKSGRWLAEKRGVSAPLIGRCAGGSKRRAQWLFLPVSSGNASVPPWRRRRRRNVAAIKVTRRRPLRFKRFTLATGNGNSLPLFFLYFLYFLFFFFLVALISHHQAQFLDWLNPSSVNR